MFLMAGTQLKEQIALREKAEINERLALQLAQSQNKLIEAQQKLAELNTETYNSAIGKDSYCYAALSIPSDPNADQVNVYLHHVGKYGLRNLEVFIVNTDIEFGQILDQNIDYKEEQEDYHNFRNPYYDRMASFTADDVPTPLKSFRTVRRDQKSFHIRFKTDNKTWYQRVLLRRVGGYEIKPEYNSPIYDYDNWFLVAYQVYEVDKWGYAKVHRYEKILMESTVSDEYYPQAIRTGGQKIWRPFPLKRSELEYLPFLRWPSLHWDGASFDRNPALPSSK